MNNNCHCGKSLHYTDPQAQADVEKLIEISGEFVKICLNGKCWKVPRHYVALHGIKAQELSTLGFEETK